MRARNLWGFALIVVACASSEEGELFNEPDAATGVDVSIGTGGGTGATGGTSGTGGGTGATGGGTSGTGGGTSGTGGGTSGTGGTSGSGGTTTTPDAGGGSCNPAFCPNTGSGSPCCVSPNGPCGSDFGVGCQQNAGPDV